MNQKKSRAIAQRNSALPLKLAFERGAKGPSSNNAGDGDQCRGHLRSLFLHPLHPEVF